jgi:hypothetical protein
VIYAPSITKFSDMMPGTGVIATPAYVMTNTLCVSPLIDPPKEQEPIDHPRGRQQPKPFDRPRRKGKR